MIRHLLRQLKIHRGRQLFSTIPRGSTVSFTETHAKSVYPPPGLDTMMERRGVRGRTTLVRVVYTLERSRLPSGNANKESFHGRGNELSSRSPFSFLVRVKQIHVRCSNKFLRSSNFIDKSVRTLLDVNYPGNMFRGTFIPR